MHWKANGSSPNGEGYDITVVRADMTKSRTGHFPCCLLRCFLSERLLFATSIQYFSLPMASEEYRQLQSLIDEEALPFEYAAPIQAARA